MTEPYPAEQIDALLALIGIMSSELKNLRWIAGHEQLDQSRIAATDVPGKLVKRKLDPGPEFPWDRVLASTDLKPVQLQETG